MIQVPVLEIVVEAAKWRMLNTQLVVSYTGDSVSCPDDSGGDNKVVCRTHSLFCAHSCGYF